VAERLGDRCDRPAGAPLHAPTDTRSEHRCVFKYIRRNEKILRESTAHTHFEEAKDKTTVKQA
jgi:hypothetical protein